MRSPWLAILCFIVCLFVVITAVQGVRDFVNWYREGREFAKERKRAKALRQQKKLAKQNMPTLKERPAEPAKPSGREAKPPSDPKFS